VVDFMSMAEQVPVLGVCYGAQLIAQQLGGKVEKSDKREYGRANLLLTEENELVKNIPAVSQVWMSHSDSIKKLPDDFTLVGKTDNIPIAAFSYKNATAHQIAGLQFHPEVYHSTEGKTILKNFLLEICSCTGDWTPAHFITDSIAAIKKTIGDKKVVMGLSGGVDSTVAATLIHKAIGANLHGIFVDNGLLRKHEYNEVIDTYNSMEEAAKWLVDNMLSKNFNAAKSVICVSVKNNKIGYGFNWKRAVEINLENEEWREIILDNKCSGYFISSLGRIKNKKNIIMENYKIHHSGYIYTRINYNKYAIHRLVAMMFIPNLENKSFVNHIDGNKTNNVVDNLNWVTCQENNIYNHNMGFVKCYTKKIIQYDLEMNQLNTYNSIKEASKILNISNTNILGALKNRQKTAAGFIWRYLE